MTKRRRVLLPFLIILVLAGVAAVVVRLTGVLGPGPSATIGIDLPYQGAYNDASTQTYNAIKLYLQQVGGKVGDTVVTPVSYDDGTTSTPIGDPTRCTSNANAQVARADMVAVIGPQQVACARAEAKVLAAAGMALVSPAVTNPGLTTAWSPGEPGVYAVNGVRSFARVVPTDADQGAAAAQFAQGSAGVHNCLVLNDGELYGRTLAERFAQAARARGVAVTDGGSWDAAQTSYLSLFTGVSGVDCVFLSGNFDNNGEQLVADKVSALGDNDRVKLFVPDGFGVYPSFLTLPAAQHSYVTSPGLTLDGWRSLGSNAEKFLSAYKDAYHADLTAPEALYGVLALQVVLQAMANSDGTRAGVHKALFSGGGVTVPAATSLTGASTGIVASTGDVTAARVSVGRVDNGAVTFVDATALS
jgi:branched-chain amino acid transport system substrate-binding protein